MGKVNSNTIIVERPDGSFVGTARHGQIFLSTAGILGPYKLQSNSVYPNLQGYNNAFAEDPIMWTSGGKYHITVNWWEERKARHLMSDDGIRNWKDMGIAYNPDSDFLRYTDGTKNRWNKIERPSVVIDENGHVTHFTMAVIDYPKDKDMGNDNHNSKVIVVPFDGLSFDKDHGWAPPVGVAEKACVPGARHAILSRDQGFVFDHAGYPRGEASIGIYDMSGKQVAHKSVAVSENGGAVAWSELRALPKGIYTTRIRIGETMHGGSRFTKF